MSGTRILLLTLGLAFAVAVALLGELLGMSADSVATFTEHFDSPSARARDLAGCAALLASSLLLAASGHAVREQLSSLRPGPGPGYSVTLSATASAGLLVAAGLLAAAPLWRSFGELFDDPGLDPSGEAAVAHAGIAVFLAAILTAGVWTVTVVELAGARRAISAWFRVAGWLAAILSLFAITVMAAVPLALWWIGAAFLIRRPATSPLSEGGETAV